MNKYNFYIIQDGISVSKSFEKQFRNSFGYEDFKEFDNKLITNFVGFIINEENIIISFPKHFFNEEEIESLNYYQEENLKKIKYYMKLLFNNIRKSSLDKSIASIGLNKEINENYPMKAFFDIYEYYKKFGLFYNEEKESKFGLSGKINWNKTIKKSPIILSKRNIIYSPFVVDKNKNNTVFISECMAYAINSTIDKLSIFLNLDKIDYKYKEINWENRNKIVVHLREELNKTFKDSQRKLILNLIDFFNHENVGNKTIKLSIKTFNLVWEKILENYLENYFEEMDEDGFLMFNDIKNSERKSFKKGSLIVDMKSTGTNYKLEPDYYYVSEGYKLILDAKYYNEIKGLNYKQASYYFLSKHDQVKINETIKTYNLLLLPTEREMDDEKNKRTHFLFNSIYNRDEMNTDMKISEQYFQIKYLMELYLK
ncbi:LlaJI family restriction endonuclease [Macrococcus sp. DPC7161]|uniref:LlaJI family restriction endonuclease n=1 Tax=Macrococcus sp. DPC7161 TaxID=2507060 RepID=UPI0013E98E2E|nr:LlaJI family restriction endonuclease [Macrococcus sp. DPC7161]